MNDRSFLASYSYQGLVTGAKYKLGAYRLEADEIKDYARRWDPMPFHIDEALAEAGMYGGLTACGNHLMAIRIHILQSQGVNPNVLASFGYDEVRFVKAAYVGDVLALTVECISKRLSNSRPGTGIVQLNCSLENQDGETVLSMLDTILVRDFEAERTP